jgi:cell division transport system permease protein
VSAPGKPAARRPAPLAPRSSAPFLVAGVSGAMCFLAVCALEAGAGAARISGAWSDGLTGAATVRVPAPAGRDAAEPTATAALAALADAPGVAAARLLTEEEVRALVGPWLGDAGAALAIEAAPAPLLIDVTLADPPPDSAAMQATLDLTAPGAVYDDHAVWRAPLADAAAAFRRLAFWSVGLMGMALAAMVVTAARASLSGAAATVRTLRLIGATDAFIARAFDRPIALRALAGGAAGSALAAAALAAAPPLGLTEALGAAAAAAWRPDPALLAAAPLASAALAYAAARAAILVILRREP